MEADENEKEHEAWTGQYINNLRLEAPFDIPSHHMILSNLFFLSEMFALYHTKLKFSAFFISTVFTSE